MKIYRVEDTDGAGPYGRLITWDYDGPRGYQPPPEEDGLPISKSDIPGVWFFGFSSIAQCDDWFPFNMMRFIYSRDFHVSIYEASLVMHLRSQIIFIKGDARREEIFSFNDYCRQRRQEIEHRMAA